MTIDGRELFEIRPDFAAEPDVVAARMSTAVDISPAKRIGFFNGQKAVHVLNHAFVLRGTILTDFEAFFNARAGKWQDFLVPSWTAELSTGKTNANNSPSGAVDLWIDWCDYANAYPPVDGSLGRYVFILWSDGTFHAAKVTGVSATSVNVYDKLTLSANLPKTVDLADPPLIGFIYHVTFGSDELELEYAGPSNARAEVAFVEHTISTPQADVT